MNTKFKPTKVNHLRKAVKEYIKNHQHALDNYGHISTWDISELKCMTDVFSDKNITDANVHLLDGIQHWDTRNITKMESLFSWVEASSIPYISNWDTSRVKNMDFMFQGSNMNQPLNWDTSNVTTMKGMFSCCSKFNQPLDHWNVSKVTNMSRMFECATSFNQPLNSWNVSKVTNMSNMFDSATSFNQPLNNWNNAIEKIEQKKEESYMDYIERRNKIIEENNYANSEVFAVIREARQALIESEFITLIFLLDDLGFKSNEMNHDCYTNLHEYTTIIPWFIRLFNLLASGEKKVEIRYTSDDDNHFILYAKWEYMHEMIDKHYFNIFPIWYQCPFSKISF
jgi:surface protein